MRKLILLMAFSFGLSVLSSSAQVASYKIVFEKLYLHTDRETYAGGEDIWFKAYLLNGQTHQLTTSSNNVYVELIGPDAQLAGHKLVRLDKGMGNGDFHLGDSIPSGTYRLRAYTNWMRNFGDNFVFSKTIKVYNEDTGEGESVKPKAESAKSKAESAGAKIPVATKIPAIRFFPEGGSMIENVQGLVAIRAEDISGKGIPATGKITGATGEVLAEFNCSANGMDDVLLTPVPGQKYTATGTYPNGKKFTTELPQALTGGFSIYVRSTDSLVKVMISTNAPTLAEQSGKSLTLLVRSKGKTVFAGTIPVNDLQNQVTIPIDRFTPGINSITIFDAAGKPQCERLVYIEGKEKVKLSITADKATYGPKSKVTVTIKATDQDNQPVLANLSLAATDAGVVSENEGNIYSYLNLGSEIRGKIENAKQYFDENNPRRKQQLDLLLLTQGWREYTWRRLADSAFRISYAAEQGITISGKVTQTNNATPVIGSNMTLRTPAAKGTRLFSARTDSAGKYYFDAVGLYGSQVVHLTSANNKGEKNGMIYLDSLYNPLPLPQITEKPAIDTAGVSALTAEVTAFLQRKEQQHKLNLADTIGLKEIKLKTSRKIELMDQTLTPFGYKDEVYNIDPKDYDHKNVFHYLQHYSSGRIVTYTNTESRAQYDLLAFGLPASYPRMFINGKEAPFTDTKDDEDIMINYQTIYFNLPLEKVEKIVVKHMIGPPQIQQGGGSSTNAFGGTTTSGTSMGSIHDVYLVYLTLKPGAMDKPAFGFMDTKLNGYDEPKTFYAPKYVSPAAKTDLRTTIHWEPNIVTNEQGIATLTWYNANPKTKVGIAVEGMGSEGQAVAGTAGYVVQ